MATKTKQDLTITPATESDIARITTIQFSAFAGDPYQEALHPNYESDPSVHDSAVQRLQKSFSSDPTCKWLLCKPTNATSSKSEEEVWGFAQWNIYSTERPEEEWSKRPSVDWVTGRKAEIAMNFLMVNYKLRCRIWGGRPYILLSLLCIHQDYQRKGAGTKLVRWGMDVADEMGLAIHLEASPAGFELYKTLGFRAVDEEIVKAEDWDGDHDRKFIAMIRDPRGHQEN